MVLSGKERTLYNMALTDSLVYTAHLNPGAAQALCHGLGPCAYSLDTTI